MNKGLVHIYCGEGKGKTTAAVGLAVRMAGSGGKILFFQFLKNNKSSERKILEQIQNIDLISGPDNMRFTFRISESEKQSLRETYAETVKAIKKRMVDYDMLVLDEAIAAIEKGFLNKEDIIDLIKTKNDNIEIVLTGRYPCDELMEYADYITEMKKIKHPYDKGINARLGIEI